MASINGLLYVFMVVEPVPVPDVVATPPSWPMKIRLLNTTISEFVYLTRREIKKHGLDITLTFLQVQWL